MNIRKSIQFAFVVVLILGTLICGCSPETNETKPSIESTTSMTTSISSTVTSTSSHDTPEPITFEIELSAEEEQLGAFFGNESVVFIRKNYYVIIDGVILTDIVDLDMRAQIRYSVNKEKVALIFQERNGQSDVLVYSDGKKVVDVSEQVDDFKISGDGSRIAYRVCADDRTEGELYVYDCETGITTQIDEQASRGYSLSPKGRAISYMKIYESDDEENVRLCYGIIGNEMIIPENNGRFDWPITLSDDAELVYVYSSDTPDDPEDCIGVYKQGEYHALSTRGNYASEKTNRDKTELIFCDDSGVKYSSYGTEPKLIEPAETRQLLWSIGDRDPEHLCNRLYFLIDKYETKSLWCFDESGVGHRIFTVPLGDSPYEDMFEYVEDSVLFAGAETLIFADRISDPENMQQLMISNYSDKTFYEDSGREAILSSNKNIYYFSAPGLSENNGNYDIYSREMSVLYAEDRYLPCVLCSDCVRIDVFHRENRPDIIYYLDRNVAQSPKDAYVSWKYSNLFMVEDVPGAEPVLIAENVSEIDAGEFGVFYVQLNQAGAGTLDWFTNNEHTGSLRDTVDVFHSADGLNFKKISTVGREYLIYSGS